MKAKNILQSIIIIVLIAILGKFLSCLKEIVIAAKFGATGVTDAYLVARSIPLTLCLALSGLLYSAFVPIFSEYLRNYSKEELWRLVNVTLSIMIVVLFLGTIALLLCSGAFISLIAPGFGPQFHQLGSRLLQIMAVAILFAGTTGLLRAVNACYGHFALSSLSQPITDLVILGSLLAFVWRFGIFGLAMGVVTGTISAAIIQWHGLRKNGFRYKFIPDFFHPGVRKLFYFILPLVIVVFLQQLNFLVTRLMASNLAEGSISSLNFGYAIGQFPVSLVNIVLFTVIFPIMIRQEGEKDMDKLMETFSFTVRTMLFILVPAAIGLAVLRKPIIQILFERGMFDTQATYKTVLALGGYATGLFAWGVDLVILQILYVLREMKILVGIVLFRVSLNVVLNLILIKHFAHMGLALAFSFAFIGSLFLSFWILREKLGSIYEKPILKSFLRIAFASTVMGSILYLARNFGQDNFGIVYLGAFILLGMILYFIISFFLHIEEIRTIWSFIKPNLARGLWPL